MHTKPTGPRRASGHAARIALVLGGVWWAQACFDSDEVFKIAPAATSGEPTTSASTTATTFPSDDDGTTTGEPMGDDTCIDAIHCVQDCIVELLGANAPEPDLSCFLECTKTLSEQEALKLLRLGNCVSDQCVEVGACIGPSDDDTGGSTGEAESSTGSTEESGSESSTGEAEGDDGDDGGNGGSGDGLIDPCLLCIFSGMSDPEPQGCVDLADSCRNK